MRTKTLFLLAIVASVVMSACVAPPPRSRQTYRKQQPAPCTPVIAPIRYQTLKMVYNVKFTYTPKDELAARDFVPDYMHDRFKSDGGTDGNTFVLADGVQPNFYVNVTISNDGNNHFTAYGELTGWGQGHIANLSSGNEPYVNARNMLDHLTDNIYSYIHGGWHDSRPGCPQN